MPLFALCVLNFYKMRIKLIEKYTLYDRKIKNIGFFTNLHCSYLDRIFR